MSKFSITSKPVLSEGPTQPPPERIQPATAPELSNGQQPQQVQQIISLASDNQSSTTQVAKSKFSLTSIEGIVPEKQILQEKSLVLQSEIQKKLIEQPLPQPKQEVLEVEVKKQVVTKFTLGSKQGEQLAKAEENEEGVKLQMTVKEQKDEPIQGKKVQPKPQPKFVEPKVEIQMGQQQKVERSKFAFANTSFGEQIDKLFILCEKSLNWDFVMKSNMIEAMNRSKELYKSQEKRLNEGTNHILNYYVGQSISSNFEYNEEAKAGDRPEIQSLQIRGNYTQDYKLRQQQDVVEIFNKVADDLNTMLLMIYGYINKYCKAKPTDNESSQTRQKFEMKALEALFICFDEIYHRACIEPKFTKFYANLFTVMLSQPQNQLIESYNLNKTVQNLMLNDILKIYRSFGEVLANQNQQLFQQAQLQKNMQNQFTFPGEQLFVIGMRKRYLNSMKEEFAQGVPSYQMLQIRDDDDDEAKLNKTSVQQVYMKQSLQFFGYLSYTKNSFVSSGAITGFLNFLLQIFLQKCCIRYKTDDLSFSIITANVFDCNTSIKNFEILIKQLDKQINDETEFSTFRYYLWLSDQVQAKFIEWMPDQSVINKYKSNFLSFDESGLQKSQLWYLRFNKINLLLADLKCLCSYYTYLINKITGRVQHVVQQDECIIEITPMKQDNVSIQQQYFDQEIETMKDFITKICGDITPAKILELQDQFKPKIIQEIVKLVQEAVERDSLIMIRTQIFAATLKFKPQFEQELYQQIVQILFDQYLISENNMSLRNQIVVFCEQVFVKNQSSFSKFLEQNYAKIRKNAPFITKFCQLFIHNQYVIALQEYEEVFDEEQVSQIKQLIDKQQYVQIDDLQFYVDELKTQKFSYFGESDLDAKIPNHFESSLLEAFRRLLSIEKKEPKETKRVRVKFIAAAILNEEYEKENDLNSGYIATFVNKLKCPVLINVFAELMEVSNLCEKSSKYKLYLTTLSKAIEKIVIERYEIENLSIQTNKNQQLIDDKHQIVENNKSLLLNTNVCVAAFLDFTFDKITNLPASGERMLNLLNEFETKLDHQILVSKINNAMQFKMTYGNFPEIMQKFSGID